MPLLRNWFGEFDDQNAVLGDQAHQHHESDLAVHVQRAAITHRRVDPQASNAPVIASGTVT